MDVGFGLVWATKNARHPHSLAQAYRIEIYCTTHWYLMGLGLAVNHQRS